MVRFGCPKHQKVYQGHKKVPWADSICLRTVAEVELDCGWVVAGYETHRVLSYDLDTSFDALDNQIGPSVWLLRCFEVIKPEPQKTEIWEIPVFSIGTFIGSKILHERAATTPKLESPETLTTPNFNAPKL